MIGPCKSFTGIFTAPIATPIIVTWKHYLRISELVNWIPCGSWKSPVLLLAERLTPEKNVNVSKKGSEVNVCDQSLKTYFKM